MTGCPAMLALFRLALLTMPSVLPAAEAPRSIVVILVDDQPHDAESCMGRPILKTLATDSPVKGGVRFANACATTSLCSPSRPSILIGLYAHSHRVVDNQSGMPDGLRRG
jgi:arylsulfatase A-like enzyme